MKPPRFPSIALFGLLLLPACSGNELVGIHVTLDKDGSGTVTTRALATPEPDRAEDVARGVTYTARAAVVAAQGTFQRLDDVKFGGDTGLRFAARLGGDPPGLRVYVPRGPDTAWLKALVPDRATRVAMAKVYDPSGKTREVGDVIRLEIAVPGDVVASDVFPAGRGIEADRERKRAFLLLPARGMFEGGEELVWDITWR